MNFDFSPETTAMRDQVRRFLTGRIGPGTVRRQAASGEPFDRALWSEMARMGWLGVTMPEAFGGAGLGYEALCMLAEEIGRTLAPVPFSASLYLTAEAVSMFGTPAQMRSWLPGIADGSVVATFALAEGAGEPVPANIAARASSGTVSGRKLPVFDGGAADIVIVAARDATREIGLYLVERGPGLAAQPLRTLDLGGSAVALRFDLSPAERLPGAANWSDIMRLLDRGAILFAFEQLGGAQAALDMAVGYARDRFAFGRPIGALQAVKHQLADIYVAVELARSNAYYGAWALDSGVADLASAAAAARVAATIAYERAATQNIQTHGGIGFTWEADCHLHYRRAKRLSGQIGSARFWRNRLIDMLSARTPGGAKDGL
jgi:acyl-CoA dehydrogenase